MDCAVHSFTVYEGIINSAFLAHLVIWKTHVNKKPWALGKKKGSFKKKTVPRHRHACEGHGVSHRLVIISLNPRITFCFFLFQFICAQGTCRGTLFAVSLFSRACIKIEKLQQKEQWINCGLLFKYIVYLRKWQTSSMKVLWRVHINNVPIRVLKITAVQYGY